jgi:hypothetical protein
VMRLSMGPSSIKTLLTSADVKSRAAMTSSRMIGAHCLVNNPIIGRHVPLVFAPICANMI